MSLTASRVVEDLSVAPDHRFRRLVDVLRGFAEADAGIGQIEVVVQVGGEEALRARVGPEQATDAPLTAICGSAFKPALALCLLQVLHRAHIDPDEPLALHGVDLVDARTTGRHLVDHQAGLPHIRAVAPEVGSLGDGPAVTAALRRTSPLWSPGVRSAYHAISYGYLVGAVCEDLTQGAESMTDLLWDLVLTPAGIGSDEITLPGDDGAAPAFAAARLAPAAGGSAGAAGLCATGWGCAIVAGVVVVVVVGGGVVCTTTDICGGGGSSNSPSVTEPDRPTQPERPVPVPQPDPGGQGGPPTVGGPPATSDCWPTSGHVYRALRAGEDPAAGLRAANPAANYTMTQHVNYGSTISTRYISTSWSRSAALNKYAQGDVSRVVKIDLSKVEGRATDLSKDHCRDEFLRHPRAVNLARSDAEVLIEGYVPPSAISPL